MKSLRPMIRAAVPFCMLAAFNLSAMASDLTITTIRTFASLDGSAEDDDGTANGVLTVNGNLTLTLGSGITNNDPAFPQIAGGGPINIVVGGSMEMLAGSEIIAENNKCGGSGGDITINVGGPFTMHGTAGSLAGAKISSSRNSVSCDAGTAGKVTINATGDVDMESGSTVAANGSVVPAGAVSITSGASANIAGTISSKSSTPAVLPIILPGGGPITLNANCTLTILDSGKVSSMGGDSGADLVHLAASNVVINGLVESTGNGGTVPTSPANHLGPPNRPDKPANSTAGVEVWAGCALTIDSTSPHKGEINADTAPSGDHQIAWIDLLAEDTITIVGDSAGAYAVHANEGASGGNGGHIKIQSKSGSVHTSGLAVQANATASDGSGGLITLEAGGAGSPAGNIVLGDASIQAEGANSGGGSQAGGTIFGQSFHGAVSGNSPGELNADGGGGGGTAGSVTLKSCLGVSYTGTPTPPAVIQGPSCAGSPAFQPYVSLPLCINGCGRCIPTINCPADITAVTSPCGSTASVNVAAPTGSGDCQQTTVATGVRSDSLALNAPYPVGITTISWTVTATDGVGPATTCTQQITVLPDACGADCSRFYVPDDADHIVYRYLANGSTNGTWALHNAGSTDNNQNPSDTSLVGNVVYILDRIDRQVYRYTVNGVYLGKSQELRQMDGSSLATTGDRPSGLAIDGDDMWVSSVTPDKKIFRYSVSAAFTTGSGMINALQEIVMGNSTGATSAKGLAIDATYLYVVGDGEKQIHRYRRDGTGTIVSSPIIKQTNGDQLAEIEDATICGDDFYVIDTDLSVHAILKYSLTDLFSGSSTGDATSQFGLAAANDAGRGL